MPVAQKQMPLHGKKWSGNRRAAPASLYTHVQIKYEGSKVTYRIPLENWKGATK
jgi:hypothetical protein